MTDKLWEIILDCQLFGPKRKPKNDMDFGDEATIGLKLKASGKNIENFVDHDFAFYLGYQKGQFHVGTHEISAFTPQKLESFDTLEELKQKWMLD